MVTRGESCTCSGCCASYDAAAAATTKTSSVLALIASDGKQIQHDLICTTLPQSLGHPRPCETSIINSMSNHSTPEGLGAHEASNQPAVSDSSATVPAEFQNCPSLAETAVPYQKHHRAPQVLPSESF